MVYHGSRLALILATVSMVGLAWAHPEASRRDAIDPALADAVDDGVERALRWLARQQRPDGSFDAPDLGQPAITGLAALALLAAGHLPGDGPHGDRLNAAIDYLLATQRDSGIFAVVLPASSEPHGPPSRAGNYNHAIAALTLAECYGMTDPARARRMAGAIEAALEFTRQEQVRAKRQAPDAGGWRYLRRAFNHDADLAVTAWQLMFYRSAQNAGFDVPAQWIDEALDYVARCYDAGTGTFTYTSHGRRQPTRAMAGAGILALSFGGRHGTDMADNAARWMTRQPFDQYGESLVGDDRYHYSAFYAATAAHHLGGEPWQSLFPEIAGTLLANQQRDGSWPPEAGGGDHLFGNAYTTALTVLTLTVHYDMLPILQR